MVSKISLLLSIATTINALPQQIVFEPLPFEIVGFGACPNENMIYWVPHMRCYQIGAQGPCKTGEILKLEKGRPACVAENPVAKLSVEPNCDGDKIAYEGQCYQLASTGPCEANHWLVLVSVSNGKVKAECQPRKCREDEVFWTQDCSCLSSSTTRINNDNDNGPCGEGGEVLVSPFGEGICGCLDGFDPDAQGVCQRTTSLATRGIFNNIPDNGEYRRVSRLNCHVDEAGVCRRLFTIKPRFQTSLLSNEDDKNGSVMDLIDWLSSFEKNDDTCLNIQTVD